MMTYVYLEGGSAATSMKEEAARNVVSEARWKKLSVLIQSAENTIFAA